MTRSSLFGPLPSCRSSSGHILRSSLLILVFSQICSAAYYGKLIGKLSEFHHGVSGEVYAVDGRTLYIKDFTYDGEGPAAFFYAGNSKSPNGNGFRVRDERGTADVLKRYRKKDITLTLPEGKTLNNIKWFSVYCDEFAVNFGDVRIPRGFDYPRPQKLASLNGVHGVSSEPVVVVDAQTLLIPGFSYDGEAPDAKFWVGSGPHPSPQGIKIPDENGKFEPLRRYDRKTIVLTLPGDLTVHQLGHFGVWCEAFTVDFGHIQIATGLNVPPSLKMLGVSPQSKLNCEVLDDSLAFEVRWAVAGDSIVVQLVGKLDAGQYMSFGISANPERSVMIGGDVAVAWVDKQTLQGYAIDYFLDAKSQCSGGRGSCPDIRIQDNSNSVRLLNAAMVNGYSIVTYQRPLKASDELDRSIRTNTSQAIIWAVGPLNERREVSYHSHFLKTDRLIEFGRPPAWNCPMPDGDMAPTHVDNVEKESKQELVATTRRPQRPVPTPAAAATKDAWVIPPIQCDEPDDGVFFAQMGPTGGKHGYPAITGHVGWGISWYINGLLIPEINVVRGRKYTFVTEGGEDPEIPARYHPFYITDDPVGGYQHKTPEEKAKVRIFAGVRRQRGKVTPTGVGRLCNWLPDQNQPPADDFDSFGAYQRTLTLKCDSGEPGWVEWTPDANTPDTVYYQCFTHRYLGWKINVLDSCDTTKGAASETHEVYVPAAPVQEDQSDLESGSSIQVTSKVTPAPDFYRHHQHHTNSQQQQPMYHQHHQHRHYPQFKAIPNKKLAMNPAGKLIITNSYNNNNNNNIMEYNMKAQLTPPHGKGIGGIEQHDSYEVVKRPYGDQVQSLPSRSPLYQSTKSMNQNQYHHHRHLALPHHHHRIESAPLALMGYQNKPSQAAYYHQIQSGRGSESLGSWSSVNNPASSNGVILDQHVTDLDQEVHQSAQVPVSIIASPNQLSNLIPDKRPIMSYGQMKFAYPQPGSAQYIYSRPGQSHPHKTQIMIIRRPVQRQPPPRRPIMESMMMSNELSSQSRPIVMERKEATSRGSTGQHSSYHQPIKSYKQRSKIEAKMSMETDAAPVDQAASMKPAENTGFNPDSIIIESGFKPIIREPDHDNGRAYGFSQIVDSAENQTEKDYFEPMYRTSSNGRNDVTGQRKKLIRGQSNPAKMRLDDLDDMEMAADRVDSFYLPPSGSNVASKKIDDHSSSGTLIAFDGRRLTDSSLAQSVPRDEEKRPRSRLSSASLSRTPQFGKFKGELPPPIPGGIKIENVPQIELRGRTHKDPRTLQSQRSSTKLTAFERPKRSAQLPEAQTIFDVIGKTNVSEINGLAGNDDAESTLSSTGQMLITNIQYIFLTVVLYYAI